MENLKYALLVILALSIAGFSLGYFITHCWGVPVAEMPAQCLLIR